MMYLTTDLTTIINLSKCSKIYIRQADDEKWEAIAKESSENSEHVLIRLDSEDAAKEFLLNLCRNMNYMRSCSSNNPMGINLTQFVPFNSAYETNPHQKAMDQLKMELAKFNTPVPKKQEEQ